MDVGKVAYGIIGLVVAILMIATLAIPTLDSVAKVPVQAENAYDGPLFDLDQDFVLEFDSDTNQLKAGSYTLTKPSTEFLLIGSPGGVLNLNSSGVFSAWYLDSDDAVQSTAMEGSWTATAADGSITIAATNETVTWDLGGDAIHLADDGAYLYDFKSQTGGYIINDSSRIVGFRATASQFQFGYGDAEVLTLTTSSGGTVLAQVNAVEGTDGTKTIQNIMVGETAISYFVPVEYTKMVEGEGANFLLMSMIPTLLIISAVIMAVRLLGGRD